MPERDTKAGSTPERETRMNDTLRATDKSCSPNTHRDFPRAARHGGIVLAALVLATLLLALASPISAKTARSPFLVEDIHPGNKCSEPDNLTNTNGTLLFAAADGSHGLEPWKSNGTAKSTGWVGNIAPGNAGSSPGEFVVVGKSVFVPADDGSTGVE